MKNSAKPQNKDKLRILLFAVPAMLAMGTVFYTLIEDWSVLDALYFSVIALTTVGFGDLVPSQPISKAFTIAYVLIGVGLLAALLQSMVRQTIALQSLSSEPPKPNSPKEKNEESPSPNRRNSERQNPTCKDDSETR